MVRPAALVCTIQGVATLHRYQCSRRAETGSASWLLAFSCWRRVRAEWQANRRSTTASKSSPPGSCATVATFWSTSGGTPRAPSDPHHSSTIDVPQNQPRSAKEALELAPTATAWRAGPLRAPSGIRSQSRVRCTSLTHTAQTISFFHRLATNNTEMELIVAVHANIRGPASTEPRGIDA